MITENQSNLKVHFAATENMDHFVSAKSVGINYMLFTAFNLICHKVGIKHITMNYNVPLVRIPSLIFENNRHAIMDSGLFTLMFGSHKGKKDDSFLSKWQNNLIEFCKESKFKGTCVEVDCQKVLGVEQAWKFREYMRSQLPDNRIINVFHKEDGQKGLDRLIEFSDYIAISVPELRFAKQKNYVARIANYIKNKKPEIDIHLLGCTERRMLKELNFCSSADSTSWISCVRYGFVESMRGKFKIEKFAKSTLLGDYIEKVKKAQTAFNISIKNQIRCATVAFAADQLNQIYTRFAGAQK